MNFRCARIQGPVKFPSNFPTSFQDPLIHDISFFFYSFFFFPPRYFYDVSIIHATKLFQPGLNTFWSRCRSIFRIIRTISTPNCSSLDIFLYSIPKIPAKFKFLIDFFQNPLLFLLIHARKKLASKLLQNSQIWIHSSKWWIANFHSKFDSKDSYEV